jgi:hypothetical protein
MSIVWVYSTRRICDVCKTFFPAEDFEVVEEPDSFCKFVPLANEPPAPGAPSYEAGWREENGLDTCPSCRGKSRVIDAPAVKR